MDSTIIIYIIVDVIIAVLIWLYYSGQSSNSKTLVSQLKVENESLKSKLAETEKNVIITLTIKTNWKKLSRNTKLC